MSSVRNPRSQSRANPGDRRRAQLSGFGEGAPGYIGAPSPSQTSAGLENSLLLAQFRQYAAELLRLRDQLERAGTAVPARADMAAAAPPSPEAAAMAAAENAILAAQAEAAAAIARVTGTPAETPLPPPLTSRANAWPSSADLMAAEREEARSRLLALLQQQSQQAIAYGGSFGINNLRQAQYVMAALGDEVILNADWKGKQGWRLLEEELFGSHASGELFFVRLNELLAQGHEGSPELAMVFFQALALDFRGKYRNNDPAGQVERFRRQLFMRIFQVPPEGIPTGRLVPDLYDIPETDEEFSRLPNPHLWWISIAVVIFVWLAVTLIIWMPLTAGLEQQLHRIESYAHGATRGGAVR